MENDIHQKIEQRLAELPQDVQAAIASSELGEKLQAIGKAQGLHIDQMEALSDEVMLAMLGFVELEDLPHGIERQVRVDSARAQAITDAVNKDIFLPIRESMKAWAANRNAAAQAPAPTAPTPIAAPSAPSVVMPSSVAPAAPFAAAPSPAPLSKQAAPAAMPTQTPAVIAPTLPAASAPAPTAPTAPNLGAADAILSEKRVTPPAPAPISAASAPAAASPAPSPTPKADPAQPQPYVADPYREPVE